MLPLCSLYELQADWVILIRMAGYQLLSSGQRRGLKFCNIALIYLTLAQVVVLIISNACSGSACYLVFSFKKWL